MQQSSNVFLYTFSSSFDPNHQYEMWGFISSVLAQPTKTLSFACSSSILLAPAALIHSSNCCLNLFQISSAFPIIFKADRGFTRCSHTNSAAAIFILPFPLLQSALGSLNVFWQSVLSILFRGQDSISAAHVAGVRPFSYLGLHTGLDTDTGK